MTAMLRASDVGIDNDATQHDTARCKRNMPGVREERTGGDEEEEGREGDAMGRQLMRNVGRAMATSTTTRRRGRR